MLRSRRKYNQEYKVQAVMLAKEIAFFLKPYNDVMHF